MLFNCTEWRFPEKVIALGQTYFAVKTRQQELIDNFNELNEDQKRLAIRREMAEHNKLLVEAAKMQELKQTLITLSFKIMGIVVYTVVWMQRLSITIRD